jgi:hypothetical protein
MSDNVVGAARVESHEEEAVSVIAHIAICIDHEELGMEMPLLNDLEVEFAAIDRRNSEIENLQMTLLRESICDAPVEAEEQAGPTDDDDIGLLGVASRMLATRLVARQYTAPSRHKALSLLFNSLGFIFVFLPITMAGFFVVGKATALPMARIAWSAAASLTFYSYWNLDFVPVICVSIVVNFFFASALAKHEKHAKVRGIMQSGRDRIL